MTSKAIHVRGVLRSVSSSRVQYKPYNYELDFGYGSEVVLVEVDVPKDCVVENGVDYIVINLNGLNAILEATADSMDKLQRAYERRMS